MLLTVATPYLESTTVLSLAYTICISLFHEHTHRQRPACSFCREFQVVTTQVVAEEEQQVVVGKEFQFEYVFNLKVSQDTLSWSLLSAKSLTEYNLGVSITGASVWVPQVWVKTMCVCVCVCVCVYLCEGSRVYYYLERVRGCERAYVCMGETSVSSLYEEATQFDPLCTLRQKKALASTKYSNVCYLVC